MSDSKQPPKRIIEIFGYTDTGIVLQVTHENAGIVTGCAAFLLDDVNDYLVARVADFMKLKAAVEQQQQQAEDTKLATDEASLSATADVLGKFGARLAPGSDSVN